MNDSPGVRAAIRATGAFRDLSEADLSFLIATAEAVAFEPGAVILAQGAPSDCAFVILEGEVIVAADSIRGAIPISNLTAPCVVGELGVLAHLPRTATVRARSSVRALRIGQAEVFRIAGATPSLLIDVISRMGERMRRFNGAIGLYTHALGALERHEFDPALLEELRHPIADLADFGETFKRLAEQITLHRQRDDEMASAAIIQRALLPNASAFATECGLDLSASMIPARDVGGDFFDLVTLADGRIAFGVGDVCGKGVPAALFMGITKTLIRINLRAAPDLPGAIHMANAYLIDNNPAEFFATLVYAAIEPKTGEVEYVSCGHLPALVRRNDGAVETLPAGGLPVGLFDNPRMNVRSARLDPGDLMFLCTDGVTEANDTDGGEFGDSRLTDLLGRAGGGGAGAWIERINAEVRDFAGGAPQFDDVTCLAVSR